jgi:hypothetical protein
LRLKCYRITNIIEDYKLKTENTSDEKQAEGDCTDAYRDSKAQKPQKCSQF